jgi:hypothetical protein
MKDTGNNMDCVACGKPISITAKFCGKCGAPVKRQEANLSETVVHEETAPEPVEHALPPAQPMTPIPTVNAVDDLVLSLELPPDVDHASLLKIDLNLPAENSHNSEPATGLDTTNSASLVSQAAPASAVHPESIALWQADQAEIKQLLEKQSHLLDFISLASQQQAHLQSQSNPLEPLLKEIITLQTSLSEKIDTVKESVGTPQAEITVRMPDEFKLLLEKQKIELLKAFSQNVAQNTANIEAVYKDTTAKIESLLQANAATAEAMEKNMAPITQTVTDMKSRLLAVSKKIDDVSTTQSKKSAARPAGDSTEGSGGFILFIIGLLCGLTVVLSSLAIYNFLSHEVTSNAKSAHDAPAADHSKPVSGHDEPAAATGASDSHDKPASDSSKSKSH